MEGTLLDNASLVRCNFEDAKLKPTSLLGAQMKGVNLEVGSLKSFTSLLNRENCFQIEIFKHLICGGGLCYKIFPAPVNIFLSPVNIFPSSELKPRRCEHESS